MAGFVKETLGDLDAGEKEKLRKVIMAVSAEARLPSQKEMDAKDAKAIEEGRKFLVADFACTDCHKFRNKGTLGDAPELTGYGSPQWIAGIIRDPAQKRFYGKLNDRMPAYAPLPMPAQNTLNPHQIEMLTDWLRGEWYEEEPEDSGLGIGDYRAACGFALQGRDHNVIAEQSEGSHVAAEILRFAQNDSETTLF